MKFYLEGIGVRGPGLDTWPAACEVLAGRTPWVEARTVLPASERLPPAERRRTPDTVKLALAVGTDAMAHAGQAFATTPAVFTSSGGDGATITAILDMLATPQREVSPTRFHNSVHNAPAGYWSIATQSHAASTSLCVFDFSFAAGLLEAGAQALCGDWPVLLVSYDVPYPGALGLARPMGGPCGIALVVSSTRTGRSLAGLTVRPGGSGPVTPCADPALDTLRANNPTACGLVLLEVLATGAGGEVRLPYVAGTTLDVTLTPFPGNRP